MAYLYGDSTPFPLDENFLDTLRDVTDAATALLKIDGLIGQFKERAEDARREATREQVRFEGLAAQIGRAFEGALGDREVPEAARVASRALQAARVVLEQARGESSYRRDDVLRLVERDIGDQRQRVPKVIESLLSRRQLPGTVWRLRWRAGVGDAPAQAQVKGTSPGGLEAVLDLDVPATHVWAKAVRVGSLCKNVVIKLPREGTLLRGPGRRPQRLDRWVVTEVEVAPERAALVLRQSGSTPSEGLELVIRAQEGPAPALRQMLKGGGPTGPVLVLEGMDANAAERLWRRVAETMRDLERRRGRLASATAMGKPLVALERPAALAALLVDAVAPLAREIRRRSHAHGELSLKRELESGRREELFVPCHDIVRRLEGLSAEQRMMFDAFGLDLPSLPPPLPSVDSTDGEASVTGLEVRPVEAGDVIDDVVDALVAEQDKEKVVVQSEDPTELERPRSGKVKVAIPPLPVGVPA